MAAQKQSERYTEVRNAKALRDYFLEERFEAGVELTGTEVKSIRAGKVQLTDGFGRMEKGELFLYNVHIDEYSFGTWSNHNPRRPRKLLLHRHELRKIAQALEAGGRALIPVRLYFKLALIKVEVALATGKKQFDKREDLKKKEQMREMRKLLKYRR